MNAKNNNFKPLVSIVIPVFNGSDFMAEAIDSALAQTYENTEILVVNDGSDDAGETKRNALSYGEQVSYFEKPNGGVASALNMAIAEASGEYVSWLSHDDLYVSDKVKRQIDFLSSLPVDELGKTVVYSNFDIFTTDPNDTTPVTLEGVPPEKFRYWITIENALHGCTLIVPRSAFIETGGFKEDLRTTQDYDLWFRMAEQYRFVHMPDYLVKARSHPGQGTIKMSGIAVAECNTLLSGFVADLSTSELEHSSGEPLSIAYATIARSMWSRSFYKAGWSSSKMFLRNIGRSPLRTNAKAFAIITNGTAVRNIIQPLRKFVPSRIRHALRNWIDSRHQTEIPGPDSVRNLGLKDKFSEVYEKNIFRGSVSRSGEGSDLVQSEIIRREIPRLLRQLEIKSFVDAPCGDWMWMKEVDLPVEHYIGLDIVEALVEKNQQAFGNSKISFQSMNLADADLPKADLIFSRDCLVHLSFEDSLNVLANFKRSGARYLLTTTFTARKKNEDLGSGFWRPLNKQLAPFNFPEPLELINEGCTEGNKLFADKCLGLWSLQDLKIGPR